MEFNLLISTLIGGGLALLSFLQMSNAIGANHRASFFFGIFCLLWASFWLDEMIEPQFLDANFALSVVLKMAQFLVGLVFFISVRFYTNPDFRFRTKDLRMAIAPIVFMALLLSRSASGEVTYNIMYLVLFLGHSLAYTLLSYATIREHQKTIKTFASETESIDLNWIKYIVHSFILTLVVVILYNIFRMKQPLNLYINFHLLVVVYLVSYYSIRQKEIFPRGLTFCPPIDDVPMDFPLDSKPKLLDDSELHRLKNQLLETVETDALYLDSELNLLKLAEKMQLSTHQLSYVINNGVGENFFNFVNGYRTRKAEELLTDPKFDHLIIVAIGFESGFNSKTAFNTTFKKMTSYTPTEFRRMSSSKRPESAIA